MNEIFSAATTLNAYLGSMPLCHWRTFDISAYKNSPKSYQHALARFFLKNVDIVASVLDSLFVDPSHSKSKGNSSLVSKYDTLWEEQDLFLVRQTFQRLNPLQMWTHLNDPRYAVTSDFALVGCGECAW